MAAKGTQPRVVFLIIGTLLLIVAYAYTEIAKTK